MKYYNMDASAVANSKFDYEVLNDHTMVTDNNVFPYVAAILKKDGYISAGTLIDEDWVLTAADSLFLIRESVRILRVRLGSINYRKGGVVVPVKHIEIHPKFDDSKPEFDLALIRLSESVRFTPSLNPIRLQKSPRDITATHFIVTAWFTRPMSTKPEHLESMEAIKRRRILTVRHLHPKTGNDCSGYLDGIGVNDTQTMMCLDIPPGADPCFREVGAPVVLNGILWGIVSSWKPEDCDLETYPAFVTLVAPKRIHSWIHSTRLGKKKDIKEFYDYEENFI